MPRDITATYQGYDVRRRSFRLTFTLDGETIEDRWYICTQNVPSNFVEIVAAREIYKITRLMNYLESIPVGTVITPANITPTSEQFRQLRLHRNMGQRRKLQQAIEAGLSVDDELVAALDEQIAADFDQYEATLVDRTGWKEQEVTA